MGTVVRRAMCGAFRRSIAMHFLKDACDIGTTQGLPVKNGMKTAIVYAPVLDRRPHGVRSLGAPRRRRGARG
jgi:hypothetical protein